MHGQLPELPERRTRDWDRMETMNNVEKIITEYGTDIYSFCVYITGDKDAADDLYQQTFLTVIEKDDLDPERNPKSYLLSIAVNLWKNQRRKYLWRRQKVNVVCFGEEEIETVQDPSRSVEDSVLRAAEAEELRKQVQKLPDKMRVVILMHFMEDLSIEEIAEVLKIPEGTVKSRIHQAKRKLKEGLR